MMNIDNPDELDGVFESGTGTIGGIHWAVWIALPLAAAGGGAIAAGSERRTMAAIGGAGGSLLALVAFSIFEMRREKPSLSPDELRNLLR